MENPDIKIIESFTKPQVVAVAEAAPEWTARTCAQAERIARSFPGQKPVYPEPKNVLIAGARAGWDTASYVSSTIFHPPAENPVQVLQDATAIHIAPESPSERAQRLKACRSVSSERNL
jgi:hypothetical protein